VHRLLPFAIVTALVVVGILAPFITRPRPSVLPWDAPLTFGAGDIGPPYSGALAEIQRPAGPPPYVAVVILSGCAGITHNERDWSVRLASWGYAAVLIDAFYHRHLKPLCDRTRVAIDLRARDAFNLAAYLATLPEFAGGQMGVLGFSSGGQAALHAALEGSPFGAVVAYYPPCLLPADRRLAVDTQVLVGSGDYPHIVRSCGEMAKALAGTAHAPRVKFYPGAQHIFDTPGGDAAAAADSFAVTKAFFDEHLKGRLKAR
jgi:dienelactone hydrolase